MNIQNTRLYKWIKSLRVSDKSYLCTTKASESYGYITIGDDKERMTVTFMSFMLENFGKIGEFYFIVSAKKPEVVDSRVVIFTHDTRRCYLYKRGLKIQRVFFCEEKLKKYFNKTPKVIYATLLESVTED